MGRYSKGWPPNFQPISGRRRCDFPVLQQWKEFTLLPTIGGRILYSWSQNTLKLLYTRVTGAGLEKFYGGTTIFLNTQDSVFYMEETFSWNSVDWPGASSRCDIGMSREGNNYGVLLKKIAAMFTFSLSALTYIGRQDGEWELLLKYDHDDVHNFKTCRAEYLCGEGVTSDSKRKTPRRRRPKTWMSMECSRWHSTTRSAHPHCKVRLWWLVLYRNLISVSVFQSWLLFI